MVNLVVETASHTDVNQKVEVKLKPESEPLTWGQEDGVVIVNVCPEVESVSTVIGWTIFRTEN